jgi:RNA polymerase sigma-70 factor (ECF subfamily)
VHSIIGVHPNFARSRRPPWRGKIRGKTVRVVQELFEELFFHGLSSFVVNNAISANIIIERASREGEIMGDGRIQQPKKRSRAPKVRPGRGGYPDNLVSEALTSPEALEELCDHYVPRIYNFVLRRVGRVQDAEDITSIVFEKVILNLRSFDESRASFSTWIYRIATNCVTDYYRSKGRKRESSLDDEAMGLRHPGDAGLQSADLHVALLDLLRQLPPRYREAVALRYFAGMRVQEVAETLGITESAASKRILRGLDELRRLAAGGPLEELM